MKKNVKKQEFANIIEVFRNYSPVSTFSIVMIVAVRQNTRLYEKQLNDTLATVLSFSRY